MIINHDTKEYRRKWAYAGANQYNGAFYYSKEICKYIIPNIRTDRNWITVNVRGVGCDHAIVFIHNNLHPENYNWLSKYNDLILVCGVKTTMPKVQHLGTTLYLPLSIDVDDVAKYKTQKTKGTAFAGRIAKSRQADFKDGVDFLTGLPRTKFLAELAKYKQVYAVGRTAIEAKVLGCKVLPYDQRFPDPAVWRIVDYKQAVKILQKKLDKIERSKK